MTNMNGFSIRKAMPGDEKILLDLILELARYEKLESEVVATPELLYEQIFDLKRCEVIFGCLDGEVIGYALFFHSFSTFLGRGGIYLEDLYVKREHRGMGYGKALLTYLASETVKRGCGRLEWACLDWNAPSIAFYKSLGAVPQDGWTVYRLTGDSLSELSDKADDK